MVWIALKTRKPPKHADVVYGWWCYWRDYISWEIADDHSPSATHWCQLPKAPSPDPAKVPARAKAA